MVGSKSVALCFEFYSAQVRLHMNFQAHNQKSSRICDQLVVNFEPWQVHFWASKSCLFILIKYHGHHLAFTTEED